MQLIKYTKPAEEEISKIVLREINFERRTILDLNQWKVQDE